MKDHGQNIGIFIEKDNDIKSKYQDKLQKEFSIEFFDTIPASLSYLVDNNINILFAIIRLSSDIPKVILSFLENIHGVNPFIKIVAIEVNSTVKSQFGEIIKKYEIITVYDTEDGDTLMHRIQSNLLPENTPKRKYSRVNWPLNVKVSFLDDKEKQSFDSNVLSISANGAYISNDADIPAKGTRLGLTISFKNFKLFTESYVVWTNDANQKPSFIRGFAVDFRDISLISQKIIDEIIKDKILQDILVKIE